ncbi:MAG: preprotein translocase subunit SecY [Ruminococcaceae bacterium]|nr:preprotein translocase subunit SecY [Oscillospiraceae bacterium]
MFQTLKNAWKVPELRNKLLFTLLILLIYRLGASIPVPYVNTEVLNYYSQFSGTVLDFMSLLSGGAMAQATLFALSVSPYITASIVMQLLTIAIPPLERMAKEEDGKKKINAITRYVTVGLALITAYGYAMLLFNNGWLVFTDKIQIFPLIVIIACYCAGASLIMWLAEKINEHGIGNGISMILFANIISSVPGMCMNLWYWIVPAAGKFNLGGLFGALGVVIAVLGLTVLCVWFTNSERKIPIQYAKRVVGRKMYGGQGTHLPLKMNMTGVMPIIFASSIVSIPATIVQMFSMDTNYNFAWFVDQYLQTNRWPYILIYLVLLIAFSYFYTMISFNPVEVANNIRNNGGAIPGIRPGRPTSDFIKKVLNRITLIGAFFLIVVAGLPMIAGVFSTQVASLAFGGSSLLIVVGVALETIRDLEAQMTMRNYKGFLD